MSFCIRPQIPVSAVRHKEYVLDLDETTWMLGNVVSAKFFFFFFFTDE